MKDILTKIVKDTFPFDTIDIKNYSCDKTTNISHLSFYKSWELYVALSPSNYMVALFDRRNKQLRSSFKDWDEFSDSYIAWLLPSRDQCNIIQLPPDNWLLWWNTTTLENLIDILFIKVPEKSLVIGLVSYKTCIQNDREICMILDKISPTDFETKNN